MNAISPLPLVPQSPQSINRLYDSVVLQAIQDKVQELNFLVCVHGFLGQVPDSRYSKHYEVPLTYEGETIYLDIPRKLLEACDFRAGDYVSVSGRVITNQFRGKLAFRLDVCDLQAQETRESVNKRRQEQMTLAALKALDPVRHPFPIQDSIELSLIFSGSSNSLVQNDFVTALGSVRDCIKLNSYPVSMLDAMDISAAIEKAPGEIVVLIRGGGEDSQFTVFDSEKVLSSLAKKRAYRVTGIGHSSNTTLTDFLVDFSASTPTAAGTHIRDQLERHRVLQQRFNEELMRKEEQWSIQYDKTTEAQRNAAQLENRLYRYKKWSMRIAIACFLVGALLARIFR